MGFLLTATFGLEDRRADDVRILELRMEFKARGCQNSRSNTILKPTQLELLHNLKTVET